MTELLPTLIFLVKILFATIGLALIPVMIFLERKGAAIIQDRVGPNRASIGFVRGFGMVHNFTDVVKLLMKEDFIPKNAHKAYYLAAPIIPVLTAILTPAVIPWFAPFVVGGATITGEIISSASGILLLFALGSLGVYGVVLGSWASNSKYSLLGGMRSSAMMISYEVSMGLSVLGMFMIVGSFNLTDIVEWQAANGGGLFGWGVFVQPVGFLLFLTSMFAETGRTPFDVAEGESEIVGGFHTEYSSSKFALFFMGEYAHMVVASVLIATLFFGGYHIPFVGTEALTEHIGLALALVLILKAVIVFGLAVLVRKQRARYAELRASDKEQRLKEYGIFSGLFTALAVAMVVAALIFMMLPTAEYESGVGYPVWASLLTAALQFGVLLAKTLFFCWLFVWVRWTLPRFRYDAIMGLGWKVMINVALINLLVTAIVLKIIG